MNQYPTPNEYEALQRRLRWLRPLAQIVAVLLGGIIVALMLRELGL